MYPPVLSVTAVRSPWRAGDLRVMVTPGRAAPSADFTPPVKVPVWVPCAAATAVKPKAKARTNPRMGPELRRIPIASKRILSSSEMDIGRSDGHERETAGQGSARRMELLAREPEHGGCQRS